MMIRRDRIVTAKFGVVIEHDIREGANDCFEDAWFEVRCNVQANCHLKVFFVGFLAEALNLRVQHHRKLFGVYNHSLGF